MDKVERRVVPADVTVRMVLRQAQDGEEERPQIEGYAAVFDQESVDLGGFREVIHRGTFAKTIKEQDIRGLINHDANLVLGRNRAGTLELAEDDHGLRFRLYPPDTAAARDLLVSMKRGDVDQMSFGFEAVQDRWESDERGALRHLLEARLFDVSVVTFPAYPQTSAEARATAGTLTQPLPEGGGEGGEPRSDDGDDPEVGVEDMGSEGDGSQGRRSLVRARLELAKRQ